jgi:DNA uptake protein ComE-like DNA-binding protein
MNAMNRLAAAVAAAAILAAPMALRAQVGKSVTVVDANTIGEKELAALPNMTPELAKAVVAARPFASITELDALLGKTLSKEQRTEIYKKVFVHVNLNAASKEEILLIPGVGNRMLHEFEEYKPYKGLAVFHREIDKYVDDAELARLEQYVFVPIDLNTATDEEILTIPGVGNRMLREFKEYRPYKGIEQFRREIGKYVDKKEVARLERFVTIK